MIDRFTGKFHPFSNFLERDITVMGMTFPSNEHAFVFAKNPIEWCDEWMLLTPGQVKRKGRRVKLRTDWEDVKLDIMLEIVECKFQQHEDLRELLLSTGDQPIVEGNNWHDNFWGTCVCDGCFGGSMGRNELGKILMRVREDLRSSPTRTSP